MTCRVDYIFKRICLSFFLPISDVFIREQHVEQISDDIPIVVIDVDNWAALAAVAWIHTEGGVYARHSQRLLARCGRSRLQRERHVASSSRRWRRPPRTGGKRRHNCIPQRRPLDWCQSTNERLPHRHLATSRANGSTKKTFVLNVHHHFDIVILSRDAPSASDVIHSDSTLTGSPKQPEEPLQHSLEAAAFAVHPAILV